MRCDEMRFNGVDDGEKIEKEDGESCEEGGLVGRMSQPSDDIIDAGCWSRARS